MRLKTNLAALLPLCLALAACDDYLTQIPASSEAQPPIVLSAPYPTATRASDAGFEDGDRMGVYVLDYDGESREQLGDLKSHASNVLYTFDASDNSWKGATQLYWSGTDIPADIIGYYPFISSVENPNSVSFAVERRQDIDGKDGSPGGYEASDLLWGKATKTTPTTSRVDLTFRHLMAGVRVVLEKGDGFGDSEWETLEKQVLVRNVITGSSVNLEDGTVTATGSEPASVTPYRRAAEWRAVVVPQTISSGTTLLGITVGGFGYQLTKEAAMTYVSGKLHTFTITVNRKGASDYEFRLSDETITAWIDDAEFRDGIVRTYTAIHVGNRGGLAEAIAAAGLDKDLIGNLKVTGELDQDDFRFMRDDMPILAAVNLKQARVYDEYGPDRLPGSAFNGKRTIHHVVFPERMTSIGAQAFIGSGLMGDLVIPEGVIEIGDEAFLDCLSIHGTLSLPSSLEHLGGGAFHWTHFTGSLTLPERIRHIGGGAFASCGFTGELNIPEKVTHIGGSAFSDNNFTGNLVIPQAVKKVEGWAFSGAFSNGTLYLHDGITEIQDGAFGGCGFKGELVLPKNLRLIGYAAFSGTKYSSIVFNDKLVTIKEYAFSGCSRLSGTLTLPDKLLEINEGTFSDCTLLDEIVIGKNITKVAGLAFRGCYNLSGITVNAPEPPLITSECDDWGRWGEAFHDVPKDNFTVQVPAESVEAYKSASGWKEFKRIAAYSGFVCRPSFASALNTRHREELILNADGPWTVTHMPDWVTLSRTSGTGKTPLTLTINEMPRNNGDREDYIEFSLTDTDFTCCCDVSQFDYQYGEDECIALQKATKGNGVNVVFVGDGFDAKSIAEGAYLDLVREQAEYFFGIEPFTTFRDRFNVYACISLSQETGVNTANTWRNTRFRTMYAVDCIGGGFLMHENIDDVFNYVVNTTPVTADRIPRTTVIMTLNCDDYGSTTTLTENGSAVSICCKSPDTYPMDTRGMIQHEACGHAFGKLADERVSKNAYLSSTAKNAIEEAQWRGWYRNISTSGKMEDVSWSRFIFDPRYSDAVDIFEGAFGVTRKAYRPELNSCMNFGIPYFNAPSRYEIMRRILDYSGEHFDDEVFYRLDTPKWGATSLTRSADAPGAAHSPIRIVKSKKY